MINTRKKSSLGDLILILRRKIVESLKRAGFEHDLTFSQVEVLHFIGPSGKATMKNIADFLKITPPSATEVVAEMEKKGLIRRTSDKGDRRVVFVTLSPLAKKLFLSLQKHKEFILRKIFSRLNKKDHENFERIIRILIKD